MGDVIVTQFATLDGVVSDPDGRGGTDHGGWAFRYGPGPVSDDKFRLGAGWTTASSSTAGGPGSTSPGSGRPGTATSPGG